MDYKIKYFKYKTKYLELKKQEEQMNKSTQIKSRLTPMTGGGSINEEIDGIEGLNISRKQRRNKYQMFAGMKGGAKKYTESELSPISESTTETPAAKPDETILYLFKAEWCGHCRAFKETWELLKKKNEKKIKYMTVDSEEKDKLEKWKIQGFPTLILTKGAKAIEYVGPRDYNSILEFIDSI